MSNSDRKLTSIQMGGCLLCLLYFFQVTILPFLHSELHVVDANHNDQIVQHCHDSPISTAEGIGSDKGTLTFEHHQESENHSDSHHSETCSICLGAPKILTSNCGISPLANSFRIELGEIIGNAFLPTFNPSPHSPRGPPPVEA